MIIVRLIGGLGNQMFQYAAARRLAHIHNVAIKVDTSGLSIDSRDYVKRDYALGVFNIEASFASIEEIRRLKGGKGLSLKPFLTALRNKIAPFTMRTMVIEEQY